MASAEPEPGGWYGNFTRHPVPLAIRRADGSIETLTAEPYTWTPYIGTIFYEQPELPGS